jgi:hypothetical protein
LSTDVGEAKSDVEGLRAHVRALETELVEVRAWADEVTAEARARTYWLDRWHLDLNELMRRRSADRIRAVARAVRAVYRRAMHVKWRYLS